MSVTRFKQIFTEKKPLLVHWIFLEEICLKRFFRQINKWDIFTRKKTNILADFAAYFYFIVSSVLQFRHTSCCIMRIKEEEFLIPFFLSHQRWGSGGAGVWGGVCCSHPCAAALVSRGAAGALYLVSLAQRPQPPTQTHLLRSVERTKPMGPRTPGGRRLSSPTQPLLPASRGVTWLSPYGFVL